MYFVFYFIAGIILFFFFLFNFIGIIYDKRGYSSFTNKVYALLLFLVMIATLLNISIAIMSYRKTINMTGLPGDKGIDGMCSVRSMPPTVSETPASDPANDTISPACASSTFILCNPSK